MADPPLVVSRLADAVAPLGWVTALWVGGSLATGDYRGPGISDLDLVAVVDGPVDDDRRRFIVDLHRRLDADAAAGTDLGCAWVRDPATSGSEPHPTWTHGRLVDRPLSAVARAELVQSGRALLGLSPQSVLPAIGPDDVRTAARLELTGYWTRAARRPWWWLDPSFADLGLTAMARGRLALETGELITKTAAIAAVPGPDRLRADLRARRSGRPVCSPRLSTAWIAWRDAVRTTAAARRR